MQKVELPAGAAWADITLATTPEGKAAIAGSPSVVVVRSWGRCWFNPQLYYLASVTPAPA